MTDGFALLGAALLVARAAKNVHAGSVGWIVSAAMLGMCFVPVGGLPIAGYVRAHVGDLSASSVALLVLSFRGPLEPGQRRGLAVPFALAAIVLYPMALGIGPVDPYRWGYAPHGLMLVTVVLSIFAILCGLDILLVCLTASLAAYGLGLLESSNFWDYLLDPWIALFAVVELVRHRPQRGREALA